MKNIFQIALIFVLGNLWGQSQYSFELNQKVQGQYLLVEINVAKESGEDVFLGTCNLPFKEDNGVLDLENAILVDSVMGVFSSEYDEASYRKPGLFTSEFVHVMIFKNNNGSGTGAMVSDLKQNVTTVAIPIEDPCGESKLSWMERKTAVYNMDNEKIKSSVIFKVAEPIALIDKPEKPQLVKEGETLKANGNNIEWYLDGHKIDDASGLEFTPVMSGEYQVASNNGCEKVFSEPLKVSKVTALEAKENKKAILNISPNPFSGNTTVNYSVSSPSDVLIEVFDILGNKLETLVEETKSEGNYQVDYYGGLNTTEGVYIVKMKIGEEVYTKRIVELGNKG